MSHDTVADMLTKIRNANLVKHQIVQLPLTNLTKEIAKVLLSEGYIVSFEELKNGTTSSLLLVLKYSGKDRVPKITNIKRVSRPGLRVYNNAKKNASCFRWVWNRYYFYFQRFSNRSICKAREYWW